MKITIGQRLGSFDVTSVLGQGAMGEVWQATDSSLGRDVALKVLPEDFADNPERHTRFEREAKVLASLNHPNIATLHTLEHLDGAHVLVMELVEGVPSADIDLGSTLERSKSRCPLILPTI